MVQFLNTRKRGKMAAISWATSLSLFILLIMIPKSTSVPIFLSKYCDSNTTFAADSNYSNNLHTLLRSLSSAAATSLTGFYSTSVENNTNGAVHGLFLCRGDQNTSSCTDCVAAGVRDQTRMCPKSTWGVIWYDKCMIRYNNHSLVMDIGTNYHAWNKKKLTGNQTQFAEYLVNMLRDLAAQASKDQTGEKYATRVANFTSLQTVYALEQCTPDLSANACYLCLTSWMGQMVASQGGMILLPSCNVRYEIYPFFDVTTTLLSPPTITSAAIAVAIPSAVAILLLFGFCFIMRKWNTKSSSNIMYIAFKGTFFNNFDLWNSYNNLEVTLKPYDGANHTIPVAVGVSLGLAILLLSGFCIFTRKWKAKPSLILCSASYAFCCFHQTDIHSTSIQFQ